MSDEGVWCWGTVGDNKDAQGVVVSGCGCGGEVVVRWWLGDVVVKEVSGSG